MNRINKNNLLTDPFDKHEKKEINQLDYYSSDMVKTDQNYLGGKDDSIFNKIKNHNTIVEIKNSKILKIIIGIIIVLIIIFILSVVLFLLFLRAANNEAIKLQSM